jgi:diguanylate cyclase (GGDEF)-like protein/PAS domain S-box-containing protein
MTRRPPIWATYLVAAVVLTGLYLFVRPFHGNEMVMNALGLSPVLAIVAGLRLHRPASRGPWRLFAVGMLLFWLGDVYTYSYPKLIGHEVPFPSLGDAAYVAVYPVLLAGLALLTRRRNPERDRAGFIDSVIMTLGLSLLSWVALIAPYLHDHTLDFIAKATSVAYPMGDVLLLAGAIRLAVDMGRRQTAFYLLATGIVALLVTDFFYGLAILHGTYDHQLVYDVGWIAFYVLFGAAALHPSMRGLEEQAPGRESRLTPLRLALLTAASLIAPVLEFTTELSGGNGDLLVVIGSSAILFGFVVVRMTGLVRQQERSATRERTLGAAGSALVAATSRDEIGRAGEDAARRLAGEDASVIIAVCDDADPMAWSVGEGWPLGGHAADALRAAAGEDAVTLPEAACLALRMPAGPTLALVHKIASRDDAQAFLVVAGEAVAQPPVRRALHGLGAQIALALERASLTAEIHRRSSEDRLSALVQHSSDVITVLDADGTVIYQSPSIEHVLGYAPEELVGTQPTSLLAPDELERVAHLLDRGPANPGETETVECVLLHRDGTPRDFEIQHTNLLDDERVRGIVLNGRDVSERRAFERQLEHQAFHDPVTNLANRALFGERVRHAVARTRREGRGLAVVFLDLDDFKAVNDSLGHAAGDAVLIEVAKRLATSVRASDTAARFGGDEFAVLLEDVSGAQEAADTAERILAELARPFAIERREIVVRGSIGITIAEKGAGVDAEELLRNADAAMYIAKRDGKGGYRLFEPAMHDGVIARLELRADLQQAVTSGQLELYYQPVVRLSDGTVSGVEALLRWNHPERGMVGPDVFIPLAEEMGLIIEMGRWVLNEGCRRAVEIQKVAPQLTMAVNLSVKQLQHGDIVADVRSALRASGLDPARLTLEITESVMMTDTDLAVKRLHELKALGVRLAMDDFGTGYSSLSYLSRLPVDILKMDRSFLRQGASPQASGLANAVVSLGATLELEVVAEGIERPEQWERLRELGCDLGQGFYFARPMDVKSTLEFLRTPLADAQNVT